MAAVLKLVQYTCRDTLSILRVLMSMAVRGELRGLVVCYKTAEGVERAVLTGAYKASPSKAAGAAMRMSMQVLHGEVE